MLRALFFSRRGKFLVTALLITGTIVAHPGPAEDFGSGPLWTSSHCIVTSLWLLCIALHVVQHWKFIKALSNKCVRRKNRLTVLIAACFTLVVVSILPLVLGRGDFHRVIGHVCIFLAALHALTKFRKFFALVR